MPLVVKFVSKEFAMRKAFCLMPIATASLFAFARNSASPTISGQYIETRSADVYTGQCFANGEMNTAGDQAIVAWHITDGNWDGVSLAGLNVVGAVKANATLGDPYGNPYPAKSVLFIDQQATPQQRAALINFAQEMGGELLRHVVDRK